VSGAPIFDRDGFEQMRQLLQSVSVTEEPRLDRRFVALLWYIPLFMTWQRERVAEAGVDPHEYDRATNEVGSLVEGILGVP
jgi:hypothetical protein